MILMFGYHCLKCLKWCCRPAKHPYKFCSVLCANRYNNVGEKQRKAINARWRRNVRIKRRSTNTIGHI